MADVYIVSAVRTPMGRFGGALSQVPATDLAAVAIKEALARAGIEARSVEMVYVGHVIRAGTGILSARQAALKAGIPEEIDAVTVEMACSSGMAAIFSAAQAIQSGDAGIVVAAGMESMSQAPFLIPSRARWGIRHLITRRMELQDAMVHDGLYDMFTDRGMGEEADMVAKKHGYTREELDAVAYESHSRALKAWDQGLFKDEVVPVEVRLKASKIVVERDETLRPGTTLEKLASLPPAFGEDGLHTAGSSSQLSDGAAALLLASKEKVRELGLKPLARILGYSWAAIETWRFPEAPIYAVEKLLRKLGASIKDFDYFENNEAFAVNNLLYRDGLGVSLDKLNVHGGAIAIGHPLGASGARITVTLLNVLKRRGGRRGIASICHALGGATALAVELV